MQNDPLSADGALLDSPAPSARALLRAHAVALWLRSRELRTRSDTMLRRGHAALDRLELRRELLRTQFEAARVPLASPADDGDGGTEAWVAGEILEMIAAEWTRDELAAVGVGRAMLRALGLDGHPALDPAGADDD